MQRMVRLATVCACVLAATPSVAGSARAVRVAPAPEPVYAPVAEPIAYSGFYVGFNVGGGTSSTTDIFGLGGGQFGYNWQFGSFVVGLEADAQGSSARDENFFGTTRGRIGYAFGQTMIYGTGGAAYGERNFGPASADYVSYAYGGGIEQAFGRWSTKFEYLHIGETNADLGRVGFNYHF